MTHDAETLDLTSPPGEPAPQLVAAIAAFTGPDAPPLTLAGMQAAIAAPDMRVVCRIAAGGLASAEPVIRLTSYAVLTSWAPTEAFTLLLAAALYEPDRATFAAMRRIAADADAASRNGAAP